MGGIPKSDVGEIIRNTMNVGRKEGFSEAVETMSKNPELAKRILAGMDDKMRSAVIKSFDKGWLARWMGG